jgi:hypothetical protein
MHRRQRFLRASLSTAIALTAIVVGPAKIDGSARADSAADSAIDERASELRAFRERLRSNDDIERAAAFDIGVASSDPIVRQVTLKEAFRSKYKDLQTLALRGWISSHSNMIVQLSMPDRPNEATVKMHDAYLGDGLLLESLSINPKGEIVGRTRGGIFAGQFAPAGLILIFSPGGYLQACQINLAVVDDTLLSGALRCRGLDPIVAKVQIN